ncbi:hypothetical protein PPYR_12592 [Photinus pyralis]|uniref:G-protein coupled receptors family 1 profile domain-containing protein n=1 Tax=Photinus pyralis TaxID=7054 RepID=A0A5N4A6M5_PHOPY|nr:neuropeptide CCHamide-2 receptor-like isoform X1 [Photinus pyralis]XP_031355262.1 neuropeptide CCHamide-2 receptor-like isoform X1 [Photinus pyralis]XP_031355263.1 neuropeptide CCHamide-2 receptor-like isoform X1 [Photinus pyralis]KAB0792972.1 hypothetical protein PPYR_12592 [Photinus pyralis]
MAEASLNATQRLEEATLDPENTYTPYPERPETYIVPVVFFIIFIVGVLGNGTLVVIFLRHRAMRNVPNTYILSLALADLLVIMTCVPFTSIVYTLESWPWGVTVCKLSETAKDISIGVSVFTLTALSAERYCAIVNPLRKLQTKPLTVLCAILIWVLATIFALPDAILSAVEYVPLDNNKTIIVCTPFPEAVYGPRNAKYMVLGKALVYYILPLCIIACFYVLMAKELHVSAREMPGELQSGQGIAQARARKHVARMVLAFIIVFFVCFFPHHLFMLWFHLNPNAEEEYDDFWHALRIIGFCLSFLNSCVNPITLYCVSGVFRQHFNHYLCCRSPRRLQRALPSNVNCETSFNSTYRRHTQGTTLDSQSIYRRNTLARQNTQDTTVIAFDTPCKKEANNFEINHQKVGSFGT